MKATIFILICVIGFMVGVFLGTNWMYQYDINAEMNWSGNGWKASKIFVQNRHPAPIGMYSIVTTILYVGSDGYWYCDIGGKKIKFELKEW